MRRTLVLVYGVVAYVMFLGVFLYMIGFIGNLVVPKSLDSAPTVPLLYAILVNAALVGLFAVQHSVMARPTFKRWWTRYVPQPIERSTYVLFTNFALVALYVGWLPMGGVVWDVHEPVARTMLLSLFFSGWGLVLLATFLINHFDLFGLRQVWMYFRGQEYTHLGFRTPFLYMYVRHPLYIGWLITFWATPTMTVAHLLFALLLTAYIFVAIRFEERNLLEFHGRDYAEYRRNVRMIVPGLPRRGAATAAATAGAEPVVAP